MCRQEGQGWEPSLGHSGLEASADCQEAAPEALAVSGPLMKTVGPSITGQSLNFAPGTALVHFVASASGKVLCRQEVPKEKWCMNGAGLL